MVWCNRGIDFVRSLHRFCTDRSGNFGMLTAILMVPLLGSAGVAVDFAHALSLRTQLYAAADAAAVGAIAEKSAAASAAMKMTADGAVSVGQDDARNIFVSQMQGELTASQVAVDIKVNKAANKLNASVSFSAAVPTTFMQIFGRKNVEISGTATATIETASFMDFYILIDNTPSMGVGATPTDVATMVDLTKNNKSNASCAFACHESGTNKGKDYYALAKKNKVTMRIDVVRQATQALTATAKADPDNQFRMAVYTFGAKAEAAGLSEIVPLTGDLDKVGSKVSEKTANPQAGDSEYVLDLMTIPQQGYNDDTQTSFDSALTLLKSKIPAGGSGTSAADTQKIVFFVSDGVGDSYKASNCTKKTTGSRCQEPIDTSFCQPLKDKGIKIAVLYTTYLPLLTNNWYNTWIKPFQAEIPTKMRDCASPGLYFEVTPTEGITDAMKALFLKVVRMPRITS
ncbi:pilus assembly protein TadG-related protein [Rhizobium mesoamericanum]|nr:pilus assembly protein TadG-related protein [Rhizobium mesoamericanum]